MKTKVTISATEVANRWANAMSASVQKMQSGVDAVTVNPCELAAASQDKWALKVQQAAQAGKFASGLRKISLEDWKTKTKVKIGERMAGGVTAAKTKFTAAATLLIAHINGGLSTVNAMPKNTLEDSIAKQRAWTMHMANFGK